jgi:uncharacterized membrane protein
MAGGPSLDELLDRQSQTQVVSAIARAEASTSGEIRVHLEASCKGGDPYQRAVELFSRLGMKKTAERNGVLIYVAVRDRRLSIIGDEGIHADVGDAFWHDALEKMRAAFGRGALGEGLVAAIDEVGRRLASRFPRRADDKNELTDEISTGPSPSGDEPGR